MLNPKYQKYADRLGELIQEGRRVASLETGHGYEAYIKDEVALHSWLSMSENILASAFGKQSTQYSHYQSIRQKAPHMQQAYEVNQLIGLLVGAKNDLENGFLTGQEFLIAAEVFDSVLEQAKHLNRTGYKDPAAVLARVVLEDAIKRLARSNGIPDNAKATKINDDLKATGIYPQPQWRLIQACLDIGNDAAHGNFNNYTKEDVAQRVDDIERFLATYFSA